MATAVRSVSCPPSEQTEIDTLKASLKNLKAYFGFEARPQLLREGIAFGTARAVVKLCRHRFLVLASLHLHTMRLVIQIGYGSIVLTSEWSAMSHFGDLFGTFFECNITKFAVTQMRSRRFLTFRHVSSLSKPCLTDVASIRQFDPIGSLRLVLDRAPCQTPREPPRSPRFPLRRLSGCRANLGRQSALKSRKNWI